MFEHPKDSKAPAIGRRVKELALTLGALAGLVSILLFVVGLAFGVTPLIFRSGSMSPAIETGALALSRTVPASQVQVGDIVSVYDIQGNRITHRVEAIEQQGNSLAVATLRGDANPVADPDAYVITEADRVFFSIDRLGYVAAWLSGPRGAVLGAIAVGGLLYIAFRPRKKSDDSDGSSTPDVETVLTTVDHTPEPKADSRATRSIVTLAAVGLTVIGALNIGGTQAAFVDSATANSIQFGTAASFSTPPATVSCTSNISTVTLSWPSTAGQTFRIIVRNATNTGQTPFVRNVTGGSTTLTLTDLPSGGILLANTNFDVEVHGLNGTTVTPAYTGYRISSSTLFFFSTMACVSGPTSGTTASALAARSALAAVAPNSSAATSTTTPVNTTTSEATTTAPTTTTTTTPAAATTTAPTTTTSTTSPTTTPPAPTTTSVPPITTTPPSEAPIGAPVTTTGLSAQKLSTATGTVVSVSNSSGTEVYRGPVDSTAVLHWLTGSNELYVITTSGVTVIDTSTGIWAESAAPSELPDEIKALVP
ncbi:signal peptidase I [Rhodococcus sp. IEGM 1409]|uniref:signal peptidase I n=1 Tax=Rhodococcus sp. IEGM 1409 TaxID=3047082 RepID=UPI0024B7ADC7|nr:signal peptidase I [Rhodococcus sp. IEGM 1409]MDI9902180.1 signal peptidase I [Rhodococcus sp. IEGM 1409]